MGGYGYRSTRDAARDRSWPRILASVLVAVVGFVLTLFDGLYALLGSGWCVYGGVDGPSREPAARVAACQAVTGVTGLCAVATLVITILMLWRLRRFRTLRGVRLRLVVYLLVCVLLVFGGNAAVVAGIHIASTGLPCPSAQRNC